MHYEFQPINGKILNPVFARIPCSTVSQIESQKRMLVVRLNHLLIRDRREKLGGVLLNRRKKDSGGVPRYCIALRPYCYSEFNITATQGLFLLLRLSLESYCNLTP